MSRLSFHVGAVLCAGALIVPTAAAGAPDRAAAEPAAVPGVPTSAPIAASSATTPDATDPDTSAMADPGVAPDPEPVEVQAETFTVQVDVGASGSTVAADTEVWDSDSAESVIVDVDGLRVVGISSEGEDAPVLIGLRSHDGAAWSDWTDLDLELAKDDSDDSVRAGTDPIAVTGAEQIEIRVVPDAEAIGDRSEADASPSHLALDVVIIDPSEVPADQHAANPTPAAEPDADPDAITTPPTIRPRAAWGADETQRLWRPTPGRVTGAVVHHTAGNNSYTQAQVPGIIRGIYHYHAVTLGWGDIGYNIMVDRYGTAWEGRYGGLENPVIAAHALGVNATTFGVGVLGNFENAEVPQVAFNQVARVIGWKFSVHGITNSGRAIGVDGAPIPRITGHRDVNATLCPGQRFYVRMNELRGLVQQYQAVNPPRTVGPLNTVRLAGADRLQTAVSTARWTPRPARTVFVATHANYADALSIGPVAGDLRSAVYLVRPDSIPAPVIEELQRLQPTRVVVLGGTSAVPEAIVTQLRSYVPNVERVSGPTRADTARAISQRFFTPSQVHEVWITPGHSYPDSVTAGPAAARANAPLLLSGRTGLPDATSQALTDLRPSRVVVVGGETAVPESVLAEIRSTLPSASVTRLGGSNRFETSVKVAEHAWPHGAPTVHFANGGAWPDAVTGAASAGAFEGPLLLVQRTCAQSSVRAETQRLSPVTGYVLGGSSVIRPGAEQRAC